MAAPVKVDTLRHSCAHVLAKAVQRLHKDAKLGIGPTIENGFYYDFDTKRPLGREQFPGLEEEIRRIIAAQEPFKKEWLTIPGAVTLFKKRKERYKIELIRDLAKRGTKKVSVYWTGKDFVDLCTGPHVKNTADIPRDAFTLTRAASAYWKGNEKNPQLKRVYGTVFPTKEELALHIAMRAEAERRDHKRLGPALDLFVFSELVGSGLPLWTPKGTVLRTVLDEFVWELRKARGYERVEIPHIAKKELYLVSGHWEKFKDELFKITTREGHLFAMKPMNCPHHIQIFTRRRWSWRELPQRYANTTMVYRDEQTGELAGLSRTRAFTQDDAHVFCRTAQVKDEMLKIWDIIDTFYGAFGFSLGVRVSFHDPKHPKKYLGNPAEWRKAEAEILGLAKTRGVNAIKAVGEAAFYGPKIDFLAKDSLGREWQVATIQLDINLPERFELACINEKGKAERIVMIHAAIMGSIERLLSILIEHYAGDFPVWLAPIQVRVIPIAERHALYAAEVSRTLAQAGIRAEALLADQTLGKSIREGELAKIPYLVVVGDREVTARTLSIRERKKEQRSGIPPDDFIRELTMKRPW